MSNRLMANVGGSWSPMCEETAPPLRVNPGTAWGATCFGGGELASPVFWNVNGAWVPLCCDESGGGGGQQTYSLFTMRVAEPTEVFLSPDDTQGQPWVSESNWYYLGYSGIGYLWMGWDFWVTEKPGVVVPRVTGNTTSNPWPNRMFAPHYVGSDGGSFSAVEWNGSFWQDAYDAGDYPHPNGLSFNNLAYWMGFEGDYPETTPRDALNAYLAENSNTRLWFAWQAHYDLPEGLNPYIGAHSELSTDLTIAGVGAPGVGEWNGALLTELPAPLDFTVTINDQYPLNPDWIGPGNPDENGEWKYAALEGSEDPISESDAWGWALPLVSMVAALVTL